MRILSQIVKRIPPELLSAVLVSLAFPPFPFFLLVFVGLAPLLLALKETRGRKAFFIGWRFGLYFLLFQTYWIAQFVMGWTGNWLLAGLAWVLLPLVFGCFHGLFAVATSRLWEVHRPILIPLVWMLMEFSLSRLGLGSFPWAPLALPLAHFPVLIQAAVIGQVSLVSAWACLGSVLLAMAAKHWPPRIVVRGLIAFLGVIVLGAARIIQPLTGEDSLLVAVQPGVNLATGDSAKQDAELRTVCPPLLDQAKKLRSDLIVFPEGIAHGGTEFPPTHPLGDIGLAPVLFGGQRLDSEGHAYQSLYSAQPTWQFHDKTQLVLFGEVVPFRNLLPAGIRLPQGDLTPGTKIEPMLVRNLKVGPSLCFEALFPHVSAQMASGGARVLTVHSIDDWYLGTAAPEHLQLAAQFRAVEAGLPLVRSASMGRSLIIDAYGQVRTGMDYRKRGVVSMIMPVPQKSGASPIQPYVPGLAGLFLVVGLFARRKT